MSNGYRNGAFALGLVTGIGLALNLFLWLDYRAEKEAYQETKTNNEGYNTEIGNLWDGFIGTFVSPSDTLAQWIMATFTIAVVVLVWRTLIATQIMAAQTQAMARDTREIGEAQVRAYITIDSVSLEADPDQHRIFWNIKVKVRNSGQSPARLITVSSYGPELATERAGAVMNDLAAGQAGIATVLQTTHGDNINFVDDEQTKLLFRVTLDVSFSDIFVKAGGQSVEKFDFIGIVSPIKGNVYQLFNSQAGAGVEKLIIKQD